MTHSPKLTLASPPTGSEMTFQKKLLAIEEYGKRLNVFKDLWEYSQKVRQVKDVDHGICQTKSPRY